MFGYHSSINKIIPFIKHETGTQVNKYQLIQVSNEVQNPNHRNIKKRQAMYVHVTLRRVHATIVVVEKQ
jgi:hypothetical protein